MKFIAYLPTLLTMLASLSACSDRPGEQEIKTNRKLTEAEGQCLAGTLQLIPLLSDLQSGVPFSPELREDLEKARDTLKKGIELDSNHKLPKECESMLQAAEAELSGGTPSPHAQPKVQPEVPASGWPSG